MSKTKSWYQEMKEDAEVMSKEDFVKKHGSHQVDLWEEVHKELVDYEDMQSRLDQAVSRMNRAFSKKLTN